MIKTHILYMMIMVFFTGTLVEVSEGFIGVTDDEKYQKWWNQKWNYCTSLDGSPKNYNVYNLMYEKHWSGDAYECMKPYLFTDMHYNIIYICVGIAIVMHIPLIRVLWRFHKLSILDGSES